MQTWATLSILNTDDGYLFIYTPPMTDTSVTSLQVFRKTVSFSFQDKAELENAVELTIGLLLETPSSSGQNTPLDDALVPLCQRLYRRILPTPIQNALKLLPQDTPLLLFTDDTRLPWELMHNGDNFLALERAVSRYLVSDTLPQKLPKHKSMQRAVLIIANPTEDLPAADNEAEYLDELFSAEEELIKVKILARKRATIAQVQTELSRGIYQVVHYTGHAQPGALLLHDGLLKGATIEKIIGGAPFVFLNGCQSAKTGQAVPFDEEQDNIIDNLAQSFLMGGASGVLGTRWKIKETPGLQAAEIFYEQLLNDHSVGEALLKMRTFVHDKYSSDSTWAAYVAYAMPEQTILASRDVRQATAVLCIRIIERSSDYNLDKTVSVFEPLMTLLTKTAKKFGGIVQSIAANQIIIHFDASPTIKTDVEKAMWAALEIKRQLNAPKFRQGTIKGVFQVAMGLGMGEVSRTNLSGTNSEQKRYLILGKAVQDAIQLATQAGPEQILVNEVTYTAAATIFKFQRQNQDRDENSGAQYILVSRQLDGHSRLRSTPSIPMVGRQSELKKLQQLWAESVRGKGRIVWIVGDAGIGKSRLIEAFQPSLHQNSGRSILIRSLPYAQESPYALLRQIVFALVSADNDTLMENQSVRELLLAKRFNLKKIQILLDTFSADAESESPKPLAQSQEHQQMNEMQLAMALRYLFDIQTQQHPLCLIFEDTHQADASSMAVLEKTARRLVNLPILLIFVSRPTLQLQIHTDKVQLETLSTPDTKTLLQEILQVDDLSTEVTDALIPKVKGNPFFLRELVSTLQENQTLIRHRQHWKLDQTTNGIKSPDTIQWVVEHQLDALSTTLRQILQAAAVVGASICAETIAKVLRQTTDVAKIELALNELEALDFLTLVDYEQQSYAFVHPLKREIIYDRILPTTRRSYHHRLALAAISAEREDTASIAQHLYFSLSGQQNEGESFQADEVKKAIAYLVTVATQAQKQYANREAVIAFRRAIDLLEQYPIDYDLRSIDLYQALGNTETVLGHFESARIAYKQAFGLLRYGIMNSVDRRQAAHIARSIGRTLMWSSQYDLALEWMNEGKHSLGEQNTREDRVCLALLNIHTGALHYWRGDMEEAGRYYEKGLNLAEATNDKATLAEAHNGVGVMFDVQGKSRLALTHYQQSYRYYKEIGDLYHLATTGDNIGTAKFYLGEWDEVIQWDPSMFWRSIGEQNKIAYSAINMGMLYLYRGQWDEATRLFSEAIQLSETAGVHRITAEAYNNLGLLKLAQGEIEAGRANLNRSLALFREHNIEDRPTEVYCGLAQAAILSGNAVEAAKMGKLALISAREQEMPTEECMALRLIASAYQMQGDDKEAELLLKQSLDIAVKFEFAFEIGRTKLEFAKLYHKTQRTVDAREYLAQAIVIFEQLEAEPLLKQANELKEVL